MTSHTPPAQLIGAAVALQRAGRVAEAIGAYEHILARWPRLPDCWYNLGVLLRQARHFDAALAAYQKALELGISQPEEVHLNRGVIYADHLVRHDAAERELKLAMACNPRYIPALLNFANLCEDLGRRDEAQQGLESVLALEPTRFEALARLAQLQPAGRDNATIIQRLRTALADPRANSADRAALGFALGRLLDAAADYPAAFAAYSAANRDSRASAPPPGVRYDHRAAERYVDEVIAHSAAIPLGTARTQGAPQPIFICGMFRSGSTLTEQLITRHAGVAAGGELDLLNHLVATEFGAFPAALAELPAGRLESMATRYRAELAQRFGHAKYVTDKRPDNYVYIGLIKALFPTARIVHTTRAPLDNCLSIFFLHLDHSMRYALELADIGHHYRQYRRLMAHWKGLYPDDIYDFDYDEFVRDPAPCAARLFDFLGLTWREEFLAPPGARTAIKTASVWQVREPIYQHSSGRARHYAAQLAELRTALGDVLPNDARSGAIAR